MDFWKGHWSLKLPFCFSQNNHNSEQNCCHCIFLFCIYRSEEYTCSQMSLQSPQRTPCAQQVMDICGIRNTPDRWLFRKMWQASTLSLHLFDYTIMLAPDDFKNLESVNIIYSIRIYPAPDLASGDVFGCDFEVKIHCRSFWKKPNKL